MDIFDIVLALCGLLAPLTFVIPCFFLTRKKFPRQFCVKTMQLSLLGGERETCRYFNTSVTVFTLLQLAFIALIVKHYQLINQPLIFGMLVVPLIEFLFIPIFTTARFPIIHHTMALVGFSLTFLFSLSFSYYQYNFSPFVAISNGVLTVAVLIMFSWQFIKTNTVFAVWEYLYFMAVLVWNLFNIVAILQLAR